MSRKTLMSSIALLSLTLSLLVTGRESARAAANDVRAGAPDRAPAGRPALLFERNEGQTDRAAKFIARGPGGTTFLTDREVVFQLKTTGGKQPDEAGPEIKSERLRMKFAGANPRPQIAGEDRAVTKTNYYTGRKRLENIANFNRVAYKDLYDGIDAVFYGNDARQLEYDFRVAPQTDAAQIRLDFDGAEDLSIDEAGNLILKTENARLVQQKPFAYQTIDGQTREVAARYVINPQSEIRNPKSIVGFELGDYDKSLPLTIDPAVRYLTYVGGDNGDDRVEGVAVDAQLNVYLTGLTGSTDFAPGNFSRDPSNDEAVFVAKLNPIGSQYLYLTILDGKRFETGRDIAVDAAGNAYVTGNTKSNNFPVFNAFQDDGDGCLPFTSTCWSGFSSGDAFVSKLDASGGLVYSSYLSGHQEEIGQGIAVGANGFVYVTGYTESLNFPKVDEYQTLGNTFLTVIDTSGNPPVYSTRFDTDSFTNGDVAVDAAGNAYLVSTSDFGGTPVKNAFQPASGGGKDAVVAKFNPFAAGEASLVYSTFLGGGGTEYGKGIAVTPNGRVFVTGVTGSTDFPLLNAVDSTNQINEAFLTCLNPNGTLFGSTFLGGGGADSGNAVAVDVGGSAYVTGVTDSTDFPRVLAFQNTKSGTRDAFVSKVRFGANGTSALLSSSYLGGSGDESGEGIAVAGNRHIYLGGSTTSVNLPTSGGAVKSDVVLGSSFEQGFAAHLLDTQRDTIGVYTPSTTDFALRNSNVQGGFPGILTVDFGNAGELPVTADWNGDGIDTVGAFSSGSWRYRNFNVAVGYPTPPLTFTFGQAGDIPLAGDWNGDGIDTPGVFRPATHQFLLSNSLVNPQVEITINFGLTGDRPVAGDWNGDGIDTPGTYRPADGTFRLTNSLAAAPAAVNTFALGAAEDLPVAGDWNGDGFEDVGLWKPSTLTFSFDTNKTAGADQPACVFGAAGDLPLAGEWEGKP